MTVKQVQHNSLSRVVGASCLSRQAVKPPSLIVWMPATSMAVVQRLGRVASRALLPRRLLRSTTLNPWRSSDGVRNARPAFGDDAFGAPCPPASTLAAWASKTLLHGLSGGRTIMGGWRKERPA
jgi:hypothetical protein